MSKQLKTMSSVITHLSTYDKEITMNRMAVFLFIARKDGCLVRDITTAVGLNQSTVARLLGILGDKPVRGKRDGMQWVEMRPDDEDPRRVRCFLTPQGRTVVAQIENILE